ncbi:PH domain protein [Aspergillus clavatus NRRL 1]|uniref:PH domain protein n=1 Tax=Aspergillus clavatus (strain ATCC 1007 / CBS 513.65 / DSM 816 / NCTC 3887 / NRRL 1 / QM 1276 / 107) TaxID=344612 RepID=A1CTF5_ASPCL|nr:PH domain protein [Aspergillus clavatus NRRL 1]EAW06592.1 PH domain protein [Aspergillus clavatus NRRL 1]
MSATSSPVEQKLPQRSSTLASSLGPTRRASLSDDEAIPESDSNETTNLLLERLRAWKHMCGYLEDYVEVTAKVQKSQAKDYEKVLKTVSDPLREGHHFSQSEGGVAGWFDNIRTNTQGIVNGYLDTEKNLKGSVLPSLERLHKELKNKSKELQSGASKSAKAVEKARGVTQKHIELLATQVASFDSTAGNRFEHAHDPYILRRGVNHRLNKQVIEENNNRQDIIAVQNNFQQFEAHVLRTVQTAMEQFNVFIGNQLDRQRAMYSDMLASAQRVPPDFEWVNFITRNAHALVDPDSPPRSLSHITFPNQDHRATVPLIEGTLERKSRAMLKGYSTGYYVISPARYLHEFKDNDDFRHDPSPELSLYLPDCVIGAVDGNKFTIKGKDVSGGKVGNAFHTTSELNFKALTPSDAEKWWTIIRDAAKGPPAHSAHSSQPTNPVAAAGGAAAGAATSSTPTAVTAPATAPATAAAPEGQAHPPAYAEKENVAPAAEKTPAAAAAAPSPTTPVTETQAPAPAPAPEKL